VQHMLLAETPDSSRLEHWLDAHPPLELRVARIYGRPMRPLPLQPTPAVREADGF